MIQKKKIEEPKKEEKEENKSLGKDGGSDAQKQKKHWVKK